MKKAFYILTLGSFLLACNKQDNTNSLSKSGGYCNYAGLSLFDSNNVQYLSIDEDSIFTDYLSSANPKQIEFYHRTCPSCLNLVTDVVSLGDTGSATLQFHNTSYAVKVKCVFSGNGIGQAMKYEITSDSLNAELCTIIDKY